MSATNIAISGAQAAGTTSVSVEPLSWWRPW